MNTDGSIPVADPAAPSRFTKGDPRAIEAGKRGAATRKRQKEEREARLAAYGEAAGPDGMGDATDGLVGLLRGIADDPKAPESARVSAVRAIGELQGVAKVVKPRTTTALEAMTALELEQLIRSLEVAQPLPIPHAPSVGGA